MLDTATALEQLRRSPKFREWGKLRLSDLEQSQIATDKHYTPSEVGKLWGVSVDLVRDIFKDEDGVLIVDRPGTRTKRSYSTMRIPESILERVYNQLSKR